MNTHTGRLNPSEEITLRLIESAANMGARAPTCDEIMDELGCKAVSTTSYAVSSLERRGIIKVDRYQRERQITIAATGKQTAPVKTPTPHWRTIPRPKAIPSVSADSVSDKKPDVAKQMHNAAAQEGMSLNDFLCELIWMGWLTRMNSRG